MDPVYRRRLVLAATLSWMSPLSPACSSQKCTEGARTCSPDERTLTICEVGVEKVIDCAAERGQLCEAGACVDPWRYGAPVFGTCPNEPRATTESLAQKAEYYDAIATRLHLSPELGFVENVELRADASDATKPAVPEATATYRDVERFLSGENDGLWSALYLASQAYRYAVTRSEEALSTIKVLLDGERVRMRITGVPGLFTRQYLPPNAQGVSCPTDDASYTTDAEKDDNRWVQIRGDGCVWVVDRTTSQWQATDHCGLDEFAGYCWLDNVSKDEYAGHMFALGALSKVVDDPEVQSTVVELLGEVGDHLVSNKMRFRDWDGRTTEHGRFLPFYFDDFPGFNAAMGMAFVRMAADATKRTDLVAFYEDCLLQKSGTVDCLDSGLVDIEPYTTFLSAAGMYVGNEGCGSNYNNISMHMLSMHHLIWFERDPKLRAEIQHSFDVDVVRAPDQPRAIIRQNNPFFDFLWAAQKALGPGSDGPAYEAVENGICMLKQFPTSKSVPDRPPPGAPYCKNRFGEDAIQSPAEVADRCPGTFLWWGDPYSIRGCQASPRRVLQPADYLLAYWMGRFYGFISEDL